jgi:hypothetical protein
MKRNWQYCLPLVILYFSVFQSGSVMAAGELNPYGIQSDNPYVVDQCVEDGKLIDVVIVPGRPPEIYRASQAIIAESSSTAETKSLSSVPAFDWSYGCAPTAAAMMFGYYDNTGYPNLYTGPANGGICPMTNAVWGIGIGGSHGECPLSATHQGIDGRTIKGHVDDYWIEYGSTQPDPFIGHWTEHVQGECTGDYMASNQSSKSNADGSTQFLYYVDGSPLYDYAGMEPGKRDGCHGMKLFFESRGYSVLSNYNQLIKGYNGNINGFTFEDFKQEIDAGRPVLIHLTGHTMLGFGYSDSGSLVYLHDTWDYSTHSMTWGGTYGTSELQHMGVTVFIPALEPVPNIKANGQEGSVTVSVNTPVSITASLVPGNKDGKSADWWLALSTPTGWYSLTSNGWAPGINLLATTPLFNIPPVEIINGYPPVGDYTFYIVVDMSPNGFVDSPVYYDQVQVHVIDTRPTLTP